MAVYNGADHLDEQLESFAAQTHTDWQLLASDDASRDGSRVVIERFAGTAGHTVCLDGPALGGTENFMSLIRAMPAHAPDGSWLAFSDQDDVWLPDRLQRGIAALQKTAPDQPALYCSRTWITNETLGERRLSVPRPKPLGFRNALVQNVASGNTILLNAAAARLVQDAASEATCPVVHDWWVYQLVSGAGGVLVHGDTPSLLYRQHEVNQIGANDTIRAKILRMAMLLSGTFRDWNDVNIAVLGRSAHRLTPQNRQLLEAFDALRGKGLVGRLKGLKRLGLYRQSRSSTMALWLAVFLGRL
ncbi:glycosyltransferase [Sulfitobacter sp.]|uniref:glycosyltransferase n=1 Tax=Sulfitobacter sp. TaxID=1903071 RepID=UPI00300139BF